ncbi:unnamed protein product [Cuscuta campestris]|uniref:Uncharacterized protein n=1 Tax=Cuscuta campestris TaxID=132261 RepID=A0A484LVA8_9ASTE|nr:unnamed protein product [Cuscuta campestris]
MVFGVAHISSSLNDTSIHKKQLTEMNPPLLLLQALQHKMLRGNARIGNSLFFKELGVTALHIKFQTTTGVGNTRNAPGLGAQSALRPLARSGLKIGRIEDVAPIPTDST